MNSKYFLPAIIIPFLSLIIFSVKAANQNLNGKKLYMNCSSCHQPDGKGIPGFYPPHVGHVPDLLKAKGGRQYVIHVVLYGLSGIICVNNKVYGKTAVMPAWDTLLTNAQITSVLNYISFSLGNNKLKLPNGFKPFNVNEIKKEKSHFMTSKQVYAERIQLYGKPCNEKK